MIDLTTERENLETICSKLYKMSSMNCRNLKQDLDINTFNEMSNTLLLVRELNLINFIHSNEGSRLFTGNPNQIFECLGQKPLQLTSLPKYTQKSFSSCFQHKLDEFIQDPNNYIKPISELIKEKSNLIAIIANSTLPALFYFYSEQYYISKASQFFCELLNSADFNFDSICKLIRPFLFSMYRFYDCLWSKFGNLYSCISKDETEKVGEHFKTALHSSVYSIEAPYYKVISQLSRIQGGKFKKFLIEVLFLESAQLFSRFSPIFKQNRELLLQRTFVPYFEGLVHKYEEHCEECESLIDIIVNYSGESNSQPISPTALYENRDINKFSLAFNSTDIRIFSEMLSFQQNAPNGEYLETMFLFFTPIVTIVYPKKDQMIKQIDDSNDILFHTIPISKYEDFMKNPSMKSMEKIQAQYFPLPPEENRCTRIPSQRFKFVSRKSFPKAGQYLNIHDCFSRKPPPVNYSEEFKMFCYYDLAKHFNTNIDYLNCFLKNQILWESVKEYQKIMHSMRFLVLSRLISKRIQQEMAPQKQQQSNPKNGKSGVPDIKGTAIQFITSMGEGSTPDIKIAAIVQSLNIYKVAEIRDLVPEDTRMLFETATIAFLGDNHPEVDKRHNCLTHIITCEPGYFYVGDLFLLLIELLDQIKDTAYLHETNNDIVQRYALVISATPIHVLFLPAVLFINRTIFIEQNIVNGLEKELIINWNTIRQVLWKLVRTSSVELLIKCNELTFNK